MIEYGIDLSVKINNSPVNDVPMSSTFIRLDDSIFDPFPTGEYYMDDPQGVLKEQGFMTEGINFDIGLGDDKGHRDINVPFYIDSVETMPNTTLGLIGGKLKFSLKHKFFKTQSAMSKFWGNEIISTMVNDLFSPGYTSVQREATSGADDFWCPGRLPSDYLKDVLLPYANSQANGDSPYVGFGNLKNQFVFRSLKDLMNQAPTKTLKYGIESLNTDMLSYDTDVMYDVSPFTNGLQNSKRFWNQNFSAFQEDDMSFDSVTDSTFDHVIGGGRIPILADNSNPTVFYYDGNVRDQTEGQKKFLLARRNYRFLTTYFQEKVLVTGPFQPMLWSGLTVELETYLPGDSQNVLQRGAYFSGKWLIERSHHELDGISKKVNSVLVLSRKTSTQVGQSSINGSLISA